MSRAVKPGDLGAVLRSTEKGNRRAVMRGIARAARRGKRHLVAETNAHGKVYLGQFKSAWRVLPIRGGKDGYELLNDAPHAGIIELGARPHPVSREGVESIREWVRKKLLGISPTMAAENDGVVDGIVWGIVNKLKRHGQRGTFLVRSSLPELRRYLKQEVERSLRESGGKR